MAAAAPRGRWPRRCSPAEVPACRSPSAAEDHRAAASRTGVWSRPPPWPPCCSAETTSAGAPALQRLEQFLLGELGEGGGVVGCRTRAVAGVWLRRILAAAAPLLRRLDARAQRLHEIGDLRRRLLGLDHDLLAGALLLDQLRDAVPIGVAVGRVVPVGGERVDQLLGGGAVSYTHLTLPTILRVYL